MTGQEIILGKDVFEWLLTYGYPVFIFVSIVDSTYIGFFAGILSSWGVFNPFIIWTVSVIVRLITDSIFFYFAKKGSFILEKFSFFRKISRKIGENKEEKDVEWLSLFKKHIFKTLLIAKIIPIPGFPEAVITASGILKTDYKKVFYGIIVGQGIWAGLIIFLGYRFGDVILSAKHLLNVVGFISALLVVLFVLYYKYAHTYVKTKSWFMEFFNGNNKNI